LQARRIKAYNWSIVIDKAKSPKELNSQKRLCRTKPSFYYLIQLPNQGTSQKDYRDYDTFPEEMQQIRLKI
jgi:hypothetical protein